MGNLFFSITESAVCLFSIHMEIFRHQLPTLLVLSFFWFGCTDQESTSVKKEEEEISFFTPSKVDLDELQAQLQTVFNGNQSSYLLQQDSLTPFNEFQTFYQNRNYVPMWFNKTGLTKKAKEFIQSFDSLRYDGIDIESLGASPLKTVETLCASEPIPTEKAQEAELILTQHLFKLTKALVMGVSVDSNKEWKIKNDTLFHESTWVKALDTMSSPDFIQWLRPAHPWYQAFRTEYMRLLSDTIPGISLDLMQLRDSADTNIVSNDIQNFRKQLFLTYGVPNDTQSSVWSEDLADAIKHVQFLHQIKKTGHLDTATISILETPMQRKRKQLALNMERMRWMAHEFKQPYIWVAIPKMELDYVEHDQVGFNMRVVVGRVSRPTPSLKSKIENIVLSPPWTVPPTIMKEEVVPGIARRGGSYLARRGLKAYDSRGRVVSASAINASNYKRFSIGQAPGYRSSLGEVKFNMVNPWAIYMHDTPHREDFVKSFRAYSSGCIRVHHPKEFAEFLLQDSVNYSYQKIDSICKLRKTKFIPMKRNIDVHVVYLTNALDSAGHVMYLKDVYGWDKKVLN